MRDTPTLTDEMETAAALVMAIEVVSKECPDARCQYPDNECPTCVWWREYSAKWLARLAVPARSGTPDEDEDNVVVADQAAS
jgi:hypothetical protein